ncbi:MAG: hypothetical protein ACT4PO_11355, partial [Actinomycetota bacterium]
GSLLLIHGGEFVYRLVTGKARRDTPRTLRGINLSKAKEALRLSVPSGMTSMWLDQHTVEIEAFAREIKVLLEDSGWHVNDFSSGYPGGRMVSGVEIELPPEGNLGLEALARDLNRCGYRVEVLPARGAMLPPHTHIIIGERE